MLRDSRRCQKETLGVYPGVPGTGEVTDGERSEEARESGERMDEDIVGGEEEVDGGESDVRVVDVSILLSSRAVSFAAEFESCDPRAIVERALTVTKTKVQWKSAVTAGQHYCIVRSSLFVGASNERRSAESQVLVRWNLAIFSIDHAERLERIP